MKINDYININLRLRTENSELQEKIDSNKAAMEENKQKIMALMEEQGLEQLANGYATLSISENIVANVKDWNAFYTYVKDNDAFYLLQKRASNKAYAELLQNGVEIEGVEPYVKRNLNMRINS